MKDLNGNADLLRPITDLYLSSRTYNALSQSQQWPCYVGNLVGQSDEYLQRRPGLGDVSVAEIRRALAVMGLDTGMTGTAMDTEGLSQDKLRSLFNIPSGVEAPQTPLFAKTMQEQMDLFPKAKKQPKRGQMTLDI